MVKIRAKATDPLIVPAIETIDSYLAETVHFLKSNLKISESKKIVTVLDITQMTN